MKERLEPTNQNFNFLSFTGRFSSGWAFTVTVFCIFNFNLKAGLHVQKMANYKLTHCPVTDVFCIQDKSALLSSFPLHVILIIFLLFMCYDYYSFMISKPNWKHHEISSLVVWTCQKFPLLLSSHKQKRIRDIEDYHVTLSLKIFRNSKFFCIQQKLTMVICHQLVKPAVFIVFIWYFQVEGSSNKIKTSTSLNSPTF